MTSKVDIRAAKQALRRAMGWHWGGNHTRHWHGLPQGILGIGFGVKRADGKVAATECVRVYVSKKRGKKELSKKQLIRKEIEGYPTDVIPVRGFVPHQGPGGSISNEQGLTGSLACVVRDDSASYLLGSWHVMTNTVGKDGDPVFMPSLADDPNAPMVARLIATPVFHLNGGENAFDAAVAKIEDGVEIEASFDVGRPFGTHCAASGSSAVLKRGAATQETRGTVEGISEDVPIMYNNQSADRAVLTGQIIIAGNNGAFSAGGDSGALVCTEQLGPIGIIAGGSLAHPDNPVSLSFASPIGPILDFYEVTVKVSE